MVKSMRDKALGAIGRVGKVRTVSELPQAVVGVAMAIVYLGDCIREGLRDDRPEETARAPSETA